MSAPSGSPAAEFAGLVKFLRRVLLFIPCSSRRRGSPEFHRDPGHVAQGQLERAGREERAPHRYRTGDSALLIASFSAPFLRLGDTVSVVSLSFPSARNTPNVATQRRLSGRKQHNVVHKTWRRSGRRLRSRAQKSVTNKGVALETRAFDGWERERVRRRFSPRQRELQPSTCHAAERGIKDNGASPLSEKQMCFSEEIIKLLFLALLMMFCS